MLSPLIDPCVGLHPKREKAVKTSWLIFCLLWHETLYLPGKRCLPPIRARIEKTNPVKEPEPSFFFLLWLTAKACSHISTPIDGGQRKLLFGARLIKCTSCVFTSNGAKRPATFISELDKDRDLFLLFSIIVTSPIFPYSDPCIRRI